MTTYFLDPWGGSDLNDGLSFSQRIQTFPQLMTLIAPGDVCRVIQTPDPIAIDTGVSWVYGQQYIDVDGSLTDIVSTGEDAWTSGNVDVSSNQETGIYKVGTSSTAININNTGLTGLLAYETISPGKDFSTFQQLSLRILTGTSNPAGDLALVLCSDTDGLVPVDTLPFPIDPTVGYWQAMTLDNAGNLGSSIQSIAIYAINAVAPQTLYITNIVACKTDNITHRTLVGKNLTTEPPLPVRSLIRQPASTITRVEFDTWQNSLPSTGPGYLGDTESADAYIRQAVYNFDTRSFTVSGTDTASIEISGGWNDTDMSTQPDDGETWFEDMNLGPLINSSSASYINFKRLSGTKLTNFALFDGQVAVTFDRCHGISSSSAGINSANAIKCQILNSSIYGSRSGAWIANAIYIVKAENCWFAGDDTQGINFDTIARGVVLKDINASGNGTISLPGPGLAIQGQLDAINCKFDFNTDMGVKLNSLSAVRFYNCQFNDNTNAPVSFVDTASIGYGVWDGRTYLFDNCVYTGSLPTIVGTSDFYGQQLRSIRDQGVDDALLIYTDGGVITSVADPEPGIQIEVKAGFLYLETFRDQYYPITIECPFRAIKAGSPVTITVQAKKSHADITARVRIRGGIYPGIDSDLVDSVSGVGSYETLTLGPFTLTEDRVIHVLYEAYTFGSTVDETATFKQMTIS